MIYRELSILPITVEINTRVISFWSKLYVIGLNENKLSSSIYSIIYSVDEKTNQHIQPQWVENVKQLLCSHGFSGIWYSQSYINPRWLTNAFKQKLKDVYIQNWQANLNIPSSSNNYRFFFKNLLKVHNFVGIYFVLMHMTCIYSCTLIFTVTLLYVYDCIILLLLLFANAK